MGRIAGYFALFLGCVLEGETSIIAASFAAHRGLLNIVSVFIVAFVATQFSDWVWFLAGRFRGRRILLRKHKWKRKIIKVDGLLKRYPVIILLSYRFFYGFRIVLPLVIGMSRITYRKFTFFSLLGTFIWALVMSSAGFYFGAFLEKYMGWRNHNETAVIIGFIIIGLLTGSVIVFLENRKKLRRADESKY